MEETKDFIVNHPFFVEAKDELRLCLDSFGRKAKLRCTAILGPSGCGKSTIIEDFEKSFGISKSSRKKLVVVVDTPSHPTAKALASEVLQTIGDPHYSRGTEVTMTDRIRKLFDEKGTQLLIFDDFHKIIDIGSATLSLKATEWIQRMIKKVKRPIAIVALERGVEIFLINEQLRRRFTESYIVKPFDWDNPVTQILLKGFLKAVQKKFSFAEGLEIYSDDMAFRFYCASGGLVGYMMDIVYEAERLAGLMHLQAIGLEHLIQAYSKIICCNNLEGVNPFSCNDHDQMKTALKVVEAVKPLKRKDKARAKSEKNT